MTLDADGPRPISDQQDQDHQDHHHSPDPHRHRGGDGHHHARGGGLRGLSASLFRPHSHDAADSLDTALQSSRDGMRALGISLAALGATAVVQLVILLASGSVALLADTIHNVADALTAVPLGLAFWLGRRPANRRYTYGYGRAEDLAGIAIVVIVAASAGFAGWEAIDRLIHPRPLAHPGWVITAGLVGFVGNEIVARYRIGVGRRIGSAALEADGYHARTDGFTSLGVVAGAIGVVAGWKMADPILGLVITVAILGVVRNAARDIYRRLMDAVDPAVVDQVGGVLRATAGITVVDVVRVRWVGHELHAEAEVMSDAGLSLVAAHDIAEHARHDLLHQVRRLRSVTIHTSPLGHDGTDHHALTAHHAHRGRVESDKRSIDQP